MEDINKKLENLSKKIDELTEAINKDRTYRENSLKTVQILSGKVDNLTKEKRIYIKENILTFVIGGFTAGLIMGMSLSKRAHE